jgi:hypothetical protein
MSSTERDITQSKSYTAPKGHATTHSVGEVKQSRISPTMEWIIAGIVLMLVIAAIVYFGADLGGGGGGHGGGGGGGH